MTQGWGEEVPDNIIFSGIHCGSPWLCDILFLRTVGNGIYLTYLELCW